MSDQFTAGFVGPLTVDYGTPGRAASLTIKVVNSITGAVFYAASGTGIAEVEAGLYSKASFTYPSVAAAYRSAWYDAGVYIPGSADEWRVTPVPATTTLAAGVPGNSLSSLSFIMKRGDTDPSIAVQALYPDPSDATGKTLIPWPIPSGASAKFTMRDVLDFNNRTRTAFTVSTPKVHATASIDDYANGLLSYGWIAVDTDTDGSYRGEFEITTLAGEIRTFPTGLTDGTNWIAVTITDDLDPGINP